MATPRKKKKKPATARALRWEWAALPELGISCIRARLDPHVATSSLRADKLVLLQVEGGPGGLFRIYPLPADERTFVWVEAPLAASPTGPGTWIRTSVTLGEATWIAELELVAHEPGSDARLTLGLAAPSSSK